ncbi:MAG: DNA primase family protein [Terrimicrobiaceae bacterium]
MGMRSWGFLNQIMRGSQDLVRFLQKAIGYTLTGIVKEQCWFFLYGRGHNGKSTLIDVISKLLGEYTGKTGIETFLPKFQQQAGNTPEIAALDGARFVYASETEEGKSLAAGRIKDMTGGEQISAMPKYRDPYNFYPVWKIWISGNHKPTIKDTTISTWRRIRMVPFSVQIPEQEQDQDLPVKLERELSGILKWAVEGCLAWQREGLRPCKEILAATAEYQNSQDILAAFVAERCYIPEKTPWTVKTSSMNLYKAYTEWCEASGERPKSQTKFGEALDEKGFNRARDGRGAIIWEGIGLFENMNTSEGSEGSEPLLAKVPIEQF